MSALARWCYQHRIAVVGLWVVLLLALGGASAAAGTSYSEEFSLPGTESTKALELLQAQLPDSSGDSDQIVVHVDSGSVKDAAVQQKAADTWMAGDAWLRKSIFNTARSGFFSADRTIREYADDIWGVK